MSQGTIIFYINFIELLLTS